jgi:uncharacterized OB-fold protein
MSIKLNDTLGLKREIRTYGFSQPFWEGTRQKKVVIQYCKATNKYQHFPRPTSIFTGRMKDIEWREISGRGTVFSWTIAHRGTAAFRGLEPYAIACVSFEDAGVMHIANVVHCAADELKAGMKVVPYWMPLDGGMHLLMFQPDKK